MEYKIYRRYSEQSGSKLMDFTRLRSSDTSLLPAGSEYIPSSQIEHYGRCLCEFVACQVKDENYWVCEDVRKA